MTELSPTARATLASATSLPPQSRIQEQPFVASTIDRKAYSAFLPFSLEDRFSCLGRAKTRAGRTKRRTTRTRQRADRWTQSATDQHRSVSHRF